MSEVLIVLLLVGILSTITIPNLKPFIAHSRQQSDVTQLSNAINFARAQALLLQQDVVLCSPAPSSNECAKSWHTSLIIWHCETDCQQLREFKLLAPQAELSGTRSRLHFSPQGHSVGSNLRLRYRSENFHRDFIINNEGRVRTEE